MSGNQVGWRTVILCFDGDSTDINAWSNIPFLLAAELERRGIETLRINLEAPWLLRRLWRYSFGLRHKLRHWNTSVDFYRSRTNSYFTTWRLNEAVRRHGTPGTVLINLSISSCPTRSTIPVVLLSDWSYHHYITERLGRHPDRSEQATIDRDSTAMLRATLVVLLFPESAARLQRQIPAGNFRFLGHVINDHPLAPPPPGQPSALTPHRPWRLLFVGRLRYIDGLVLLLQALEQLSADLPVHLDVIGISAQELDILLQTNVSVRLHGYLSKADSAQRLTYYSLLNQADLLVNATGHWGGFSATVEAMYRRTAVLTPPYDEFQVLFGTTIPFGAYLPDLAPSVLAAAVASLLQDPAQLIEQQQSAHRAVASFTWQAFVDQLFAEVQSASNEPTHSCSLSPFIAGESY